MSNRALDGMVCGFPCFGTMSLGVANAITRHGGRAVTTVQGRSSTTRKRAETSGVAIVDSLEDVFTESDMVLSICTPDVAREILERFEAWGRATTNRPTFVEANGMHPDPLVKHLDSLTTLGFRVVDAGLVGLPPNDDRRPTLLVSGPDTSIVDPLDGIAFETLHVGDALIEGPGVHEPPERRSVGMVFQDFAMDRGEINPSTWLQRASTRPISSMNPRRASRVGLQLSSRPKTSGIGRDLAEI